MPIGNRKQYLNKDGTNHYRSAIYLTEQDQLMFEYLKKEYNLNGSALVRHLITETYSILKYVDEKK